MMQFNYFESTNARVVPLTDLWEFCQDREVPVEPSAFATYLNYDYGLLEYAEGEVFIDLRFPGYTLSVSPAEALKIAESLVVLVDKVKGADQ